MRIYKPRLAVRLASERIEAEGHQLQRRVGVTSYTAR